MYADQLNVSNDSEVLKQRILALSEKEKTVREEAQEIIVKINQEPNDKDYVFIHFILHFLPTGLVGLLLAVMLSAAMSSTASELNALSSTTTMDLYKRHVKGEKSETHFLKASKGFTFLWGAIAILFACFGTLVENLIQLVNIIGSIFYGTVLGIFLVAFYIKHVRGNAIFYAGVISQISILLIYYFAIHNPVGDEKLGYLWLNAIGAGLTIVLAVGFQAILKKE
ncbi:MAG: sodium:solute symporter family transporter, partial [Flavobacterium sp.]